MLKKVRGILSWYKFALASIMFLLFFQNATGSVINVPSTFPTIASAMIKAKNGDTILVDDGKYKEHVIIKSGVILKAKNMHKAILDGKGRGVVVTMGANTSLIGFRISNGTMGVFSHNNGVVIKNNLIVTNWMTGIVVVKTLARIEDNVIAFNRASGIQGWNVRAKSGIINHNTISYNANHGIAIGGTSSIIAENNIISNNERFGLKILEDETRQKSTFKDNNFYKNLKSRDGVPEGNHSFDPAFVSPYKGWNFQLNTDICCKIKSQDNEYLGVRFSN